MSELKRLNLENYPSFITTKTINNILFFNKSENAEAVVSAIYYGRKNNWFNLIAFVVMPDHLHLIITPLEKNISQTMHSIKSYSSKEINKINNKNGRIWQPSFRDFTIYTKELLLEKITYIHNNPVRKGLVLDASSYSFSSANPIFETDIELVL
jgi:putative transposase